MCYFAMFARRGLGTYGMENLIPADAAVLLFMLINLSASRNRPLATMGRVPISFQRHHRTHVSLTRCTLFDKMEVMKKIHNKQGVRVQNGEPFNWMLQKMADDDNKGILSNPRNATDESRLAIVYLWLKKGYRTIPKAALRMLKDRIEDIDL